MSHVLLCISTCLWVKAVKFKFRWRIIKFVVFRFFKTHKCKLLYLLKFFSGYLFNVTAFLRETLSQLLYYKLIKYNNFLKFVLHVTSTLAISYCKYKNGALRLLLYLPTIYSQNVYCGVFFKKYKRFIIRYYREL